MLLFSVYRDMNPGGILNTAAGLSVRELAVRDVESVLNSVRVANGYAVDLVVVTRKLQSGITFKNFPSVLVREESETKTDKGGGEAGYRSCSLTLALEVWVRDGAPATEANLLLMEIERALMVDHTRGGRCVDTRVPGNLLALAQKPRPLGFIEMRVELAYRHRRKDPTVAV